MKISVFGLGYVGCISAACLAKDGNSVIGVDVNEEKIKLIQQGKSPIVEKQIGDIISAVTKSHRLEATLDPKYAIQNSDVSLVCVGTPSNNNGSLNLTSLENVCRDIGSALRLKEHDHTVVIRSTILPGTVRKVLMPILEERSGKAINCGIDVCYNPEFLREGSSVSDYYNPPFTLIGCDSEQVASIVADLYSNIDAPQVRTTIEIAEMVKYVCNAYHALKITFANEIGNLCKSLGLNSHEVMRIFCMDKKLNISSAYLKPGFAFGGSCLPKDLRAMLYKAKELDLTLPVVSSILDSNQAQVQRGIDLIIATHKKKIGILGLSFKGGTDDLRESPMVTLVETLIGKGYDVRIYDENVFLARIVGANKRYIEKEIPHISSLMCSSIDEVLRESEVLVVGNDSERINDIIDSSLNSHVIIDFAYIGNGPSVSRCDQYEGICW